MDGYFHIPVGFHWIIKVEVLISAVQYLASLSVSEITMFNRIFVSRREMTGELGSSSWSSLSLPTVRRTLCFSGLRGRISHIKFAYVTLTLFGTLDRGMKKRVLVPLTCSASLRS